MTSFVERAILPELDDADVSFGYLLQGDGATVGGLSFNEQSGNSGLIVINPVEATTETFGYGITAELVTEALS